MPIVTVSREYGSGGYVFGRSLAARLGSDFADASLVEEVARRMRCPAEVVERWDERSESLILRLLRAMQSANPESVAPGPVAREVYVDTPSPERVAATVREVVLEEARSGNAVIVGRGGAFVLRDHPGALHVRLVGSRMDRVGRIAERYSLSIEDATERVDDADRERARYIKHNFGLEWKDPANYDLVFNTSRVAIEDAVESTVRILERRTT
ncbi:MAG: cytidylate kinase-like family protein [Candidatus Eisenbacteria bacterium]|uniref:Cytidylate kinase-like family protein n=1 Tax=Eiseniibacteriota bacterium TaxID=2212470 RepID=A0A956NE53_UNCEI|nr:cytidylate kinase-like family protein [Candidatus Eisenbacteria bacterium]